MYHISFKDLGTKCYLLPCKPKHCDINEDSSTERISFSPSLEKALQGLTGLELKKSKDYISKQSQIHYNCIFYEKDIITKECSFIDNITFPFSSYIKDVGFNNEYINLQQSIFINLFNLYKRNIFNKVYNEDRNQIIKKNINEKYVNLSIYRPIKKYIKTVMPKIIPFDYDLTSEVWSLEPTLVKHEGYISIEKFLNNDEIHITQSLFS